MVLSIRKARKPRNVVNTGRLMGEVDPIIRTTGLDRNPSVFLSRNRLCFWDSTKEGVYAKEEAFV